MEVINWKVRHYFGGSLKLQSELSDPTGVNYNLYLSDSKVSKQSYLPLFAYHGLVSFSNALIILSALLFQKNNR